MARSKIAKKLASAAPKKDSAPTWDGHEGWTDEDFNRKFRLALQYYNLNFSAKDLKPAVVKWMSDNDYNKKQIQDFKDAKDWRCHITMGGIASCLTRGMPSVREGFNNGRDSALWLHNEINKVLIEGQYDVVKTEAKVAGPVISIQDRVREASMSMTAEIEEAIESWQLDPNSFDPKAFKISSILRGKQAKPAHARFIREFYARQLEELEELASGKADPQLREAYSHRSRKNINKLIEFLQSIQTACQMLNQEAKVNKKPRKPKAISKEKVVARLKYKKTDEALKLVSINPADIIGAKELWIYNTKTRKLGKYVAAEFAELSIKGTTITNFNETLSVQKTVRKPEDKLKEFKTAGKVALRKFLEDINAVDTKMNGRISEDTILLKVA
jgi:hypothetical protein